MTVELTQRGIDALLYALEKQKPIVFDKILIGNGADAGNNPEKLSNSWIVRLMVTLSAARMGILLL